MSGGFSANSESGPLSPPGGWVSFNEPVILKFPTHSSIDFLYVAALFWRNGRSARKAFCAEITGSPVFKKNFHQQTRGGYSSKQ